MEGLKKVTGWKLRSGSGGGRMEIVREERREENGIIMGLPERKAAGILVEV